MTYWDLIRRVREFLNAHPDLLKPHPDDSSWPPILDEIKLSDIISCESGYTIETVTVDDSTPNHYGQVALYSDRAVIELEPGLNRCWRRFVIVKELVHVLVPYKPLTNQDHSLNLRAILSSARDSRFYQSKDGEDLDAEIMAIYMAIELFIPWSRRGEIGDWKHKEGDTNYQIAKKLLVPQEVINKFYDLGFAEVSALIHKRLDTEVKK